MRNDLEPLSHDWRPTLTIGLVLLTFGCTKQSGAPIGAGAVLTAREESGAAVTLRVESVVRDAKDLDGDVFLYEVSVSDPTTGLWKPYCLPDPEGRTLAIPLQGSWDAQRNHVDSDEVITFACINGALGKCVRWGYKPWKSINGVSLVPYHEACVRMTPADYCGNGKAHTRNGTRIDMWDRLGIQKRETEPGMVFESAWTPRGAVYLRKPRFAEKLADLISECPDRLRGHTHLDVPGLDDVGVQQHWPDALLFTESFVQTELP